MLIDDPLVETHINTLYNLDAQGRLHSVNEIGDPPAPPFYVARTPQGNTWRFRADLPPATVTELAHLCEAEPVASDLATLPQSYAAIHAVLREQLAGQLPNEYRGPAFWIPSGAPLPPGIDTRLITPANIDLCRDTFPWLLPWIDHPDLGPVAVSVVNDHAVSLCYCSRRPKAATEAGVETLPEFRGHGYATAAVSAWAAAVRSADVLPMYSAAWDNLASQAIARKLQMVMYAEDWSIR